MNRQPHCLIPPHCTTTPLHIMRLTVIWCYHVVTFFSYLRFLTSLSAGRTLSGHPPSILESLRNVGHIFFVTAPLSCPWKIISFRIWLRLSVHRVRGVKHQERKTSATHARSFSISEDCLAYPMRLGPRYCPCVSQFSSFSTVSVQASDFRILCGRNIMIMETIFMLVEAVC